MRARNLGLAAGLLMLSACAAPRAVGHGDVAGLQGAALAAWTSPVDGQDAAFARAVQTEALARLGGRAGTDKPAYLVQVGVALAPAGVGVSSAAGALDPQGWRSRPPKSRPWSRKGPVRTVTLAVVDARDGRTVAWSSIRIRKGEPSAVADQLVAALRPPKG